MPFQKPVGVKVDSKQTAPNFIRPLRDKRALIGQNIVLECQIEAHPDPVIKWLKDGHNVSQCPDYQLSEQGTTYRLQIPSTQAIDSGRFTIQAMNAAGIKQSTCILIVAPAPTPVPGGMISVTSSPAPPQTPVGPSAPFFFKELKHQPLRLGTPAVLEARVVGVPVPQIEWLKNGEPLNNYRAKSEYDSQTGICILTIPQTFAEDIGQYTCKATNAMGTAQSLAQIMPQEQYDTWFSDEQRQVTKDKKQKLLQSARQQQQQARRTTPVGGYTPSPRSTPAYIQRQLDQWGQPGGILSPSSEMSDSHEQPSQQQAAMPPVFRNKLRGLRLTEGTDAVLQCNVVGVPKPKIFWLRNGRPLAPTPRSQTHYGGTLALLKISMMSPDDSGEYTIVAENQHGRAQSSARVEVYPLSSTPAFDPLLSTSLASSSQQQQQVFPSQISQPQAVQQEQQIQREPPSVPQKSAVFQQQRQPQEVVVPQQQHPPQPFYHSPQQRQPSQPVVGQVQRQPVAAPPQVQAVQQQPHIPSDPKFRLRSPPKEYYHQQERITGKQPQPAEQEQQPLLQQEYYPVQQPQQRTPWTEQFVQQQPFQAKQEAPLLQQPPASLLASYQPPVERPSYPVEPQVYRNEPVDKPKSRAEWEIDQWLVDPFGEQQSSPKVHPYLRPPEQVEYLLQEQQRRQQQQYIDRMAPPPPAVPQKNGPVTNGTAHPPMRQQQQMVQQKSGGGGAPPGNVKPPQFLEMPKPLAVKPGEKAVFTAKATGQPVPELTWMSLSQPQRKLTAEAKKFQIAGGKDGQSQLTIMGVQEQDLGVYACVASNAGGSFQAQFGLQFATGGQQQQMNIQQQQQQGGGGRGGVQNQQQQQQFMGAQNNAAQNLLKSSAGGAGSVRQKFQSPSPAPEQREQVTLKRVDRTKQFNSAKRPHLEDEQKPPSSQPPKFTSQLKSLTLVEGQHALLDCKFAPTDDPNLKVAWLLNGKPVISTSRVTILNDFGYAVLEINPVTVFDHGEYTCVAVNTLGEDHQTAAVEVLSHVPYSQAGEEQVVPSRTLAAGKDRPSFRIELRSQELFEGQPLHLETKLIPLNDPTMKVNFFLNGNPVQPSETVKCQCENGFVLLSIEEVAQKDAGYYVFQAENEIGEAETSATVVVVPRMDSSMYLAENENAVVDVEDMRELQSTQAAGQMHAPQFGQPPRDFHCEDELGRSYFDARIVPVNDPSLRVVWLKDGQPLPNANRIQLVNNFGFVSLSIHPTYPEDQGTYTCLLRNSLGETSASAQLTTVSTEPLQLDPLHAEALPTIESIEEYRVHIGPVSVERPEELQSVEQPHFVRPLEGKMEVDMEQPVHFECRVQPANDVKMSVEWLFNGMPLAAAHRYRPMFDFGYVALDILYAYPEDTGTYTCIARNELGEAQSSIDLVVNTKQTLYQDPLHPEGLERIQELEQPRDYGLQEVPDRECDNPPKFLGDLQNVELQEGDDICFDIKLAPVNDPTMQVEWLLNEQPLYFGSRIHAQNDFGFITMTIRGAIPEDSGTYTVRATNEKGQDARSCEVSIAGRDAILLAPQHEESLGKIEYLENLQKFVKPEIPDYEPTAPHFVEPLAGDVGEVEEGEPLHLECKVEPVGDNQLKVHWLRNGLPLPHAHRFRTFYDFGFVSLDILSVYAEDSGTYTCVAENALGQAETSTQFTCQPKSLIYTETQHPDSYARIQEIEAPKPMPEEVPEAEKQAPFFTKPLNASGTEVQEGESVYLEAQYGPLDDNSIVCEWLFNGQPMMKAHRFVLSQDFGFAALSLLYMFPEDSGTYTIVIRNGQGQETSSSVDLSCGGKESLLLDTLHPDSVQRIAELEAPRPVPEEAPEPEKQAPQIVKQLTVTSPTSDAPAETQALHFDAQYTPTDDNTVVVEWYHNGQPMMNSNRYHLTNDFGFAALDINFLLAEDAGEYTLMVSNAVGQAQTSAAIQFEGSAVIIEDTQHPESLKRIQEIEAIRPAEPEPAETAPEAPSFAQQLSGQTDGLVEGQPLHLDASVMPVTDPNLRIEWFFNGQPLAFSSRIRTIHDFGYVALEFGHLFAEDSGTYTCKAINEAGEAESSITIQCDAKRNLYLESQHEQSWAKIQEMENRELVKEPSPELHFPPPTFIVPLQNYEDLVEGDAIRLECRLQPVNDPTLRVHWTCNEQPLPEGNRFMPARNLDLVTLDILTVYGEDSGLYTCRAVSDFGEAQTAATLKCQPTDALMLDVQHEQSWQQIQEIEARERAQIEMPEVEIVAPRFVQPLPSGMPEFQEGDPIHLEAQIEPTNDNQLVVEWFFNGQPLANGHRFRKVHDFGYVSLDILYSFAHDSGEYVCVARNALGEAQSQTNLQIATHRVLYLDPQHETSWQLIQAMEAPKPAPPELEAPPSETPKFIEPLQSLERIEGQPAHFQTRVTPVNDNRLKVQWFKDGQPLGDSNRFAFTNDFGLVALDLLHTVANDTGTYAVVATNELGEARVEGQLSVEPVSSLLLDPQHEQSWKRIQEMEAPKEQEEEAAEAEHGPPRFTQQLNSQTELIEGQPAHFEAQVEPIRDPSLRIQWFHNGRPLPASNRFGMRNDFGLVTLDIHYVLAEDIGDYRCVAQNAQGEASTEGHLECQRRPELLLDPQHEESWRRIQEMEAPKEKPEEPEPTPFAKPQFTQALQSQADVPEGTVVLFEARVVPINDPNLQIQWFRDDQPLMQSNRYAIGEEFGHVWLRIVGVGLHDAGVYSCKAVNKEGAAMTNASLSVQGDERLLLDTQHAESYARIQELEAMEKYPRLEYPEMEFGKPNWTKTFENVEVDTEGGIVQLVGHVEPVADPNLRVEWSLNGVPLMNANRFRQECNFGEVVLSIIHVLPHDSGVYSCRAYNLQGEATTSATVKVAGYEALMLNTQHPDSWERIQELERPRIIEEVEIQEVKEKPRFLSQLESVEEVPEGTPIRLEATFQPARDNELTINWDFNGQPLGASQLIRTRSDLGWAALDINGVNMDHVGVYTLKIANSEGEAATSASVKVAGIGEILANTQHEESWRRIQQLEAPREKEPSPPPAEYEAPTFQQQIGDIECDEGEAVKFEAAFMPNNDPNVKIQWVRNGVPLCHGSKFAIGQDFGYCTLAIGYTFPEDDGVYQLCVQNDKGEAITSATLKCNPKESIIGDVQHEESWRRIQEIEAPKEAPPEAEPVPKQPPKFTSPILTPGEVHEGQPAHFETTVEPIDDNELRIQWYLNGTPVASSSRLKMISDFGWAILNIADCIAEDTGTWECVATNSVGEARASAELAVQPKERLLLEPINESSFAKIQAMEAPKPLPEEMGPAEYEAPQITAQLAAPSELNEGDSAHLEARFTPVNDPNLRVEWQKDGQPLYHTNRHRMVSDFGFGILDILYLLAHDAGEYTIRVYNDKGEASSSATLAVIPAESLLLQPISEGKAKAVQDLEDSMQKRPPEEEVAKEARMPVFVAPLSAPSQCEQGDRAHFTARYEPLDDNQLTIQWFLNGRPLFNGSRVKTINDFGVVVLEIYPVYPEDSGEYVCKATNAAGEAVSSTQLTVAPKEGIEYQPQLPQSIAAGAQQKIHELESRVPLRVEQPEKEHGAPQFTSQFPSLPQLREGALIHLDAKLEPVDDPSLVVEWFHDGNLVRNTARMKTIHDFGFVVLELCPAEPQDNGTWLCRATNAQGQAEIQCQIEVVGDSGISYEWVSPGERKERIEELEDWINRPKAELMAPQAEFEAPKFTQQLQGADTIGETQSHAFICALEPIGDPSLRIEWQHNGHPVPYSNRIQMSNDFGVITLLIKHLIAQDTGEYTCIARSEKGEAQTSASITVESIVQVDEPTILQPLNENIDAAESESVHLECRVAPINDPKLNVQWLRNGLPLGDANRYKQIFEFGFVTLDILYAYPEDNGDYELVVSNDKGEARTRCHINVTAKPGLIFSPQAPGSNQVDNLEHHLSQYTGAALALSQEDAWQSGADQPPVFKSQLNNIGVEEGDFCRFETQLAPINDPYMKVEWYKDGKPVLIGTRFRNTLDFGYVCLDLLYALPDDTGEYACVATNQHGQAMLTAKLACSSKQYVITQPQMPQGVRVKDMKEENVYWTETGEKQPPRQRQAPQFLIQPRNLQVQENMPARFECAVSGNPRPRVIWYLNGVQALDGHRYKLSYDGVHYLTIMHTRISDAGTIEAIAKNSEGEVQAKASLDVFQHEDFRQHKLQQGKMKTIEDLQSREQQWRQETMGQLGEAFEKAPKGDIHKLAKVEIQKAPIEPLETEELVQKFTRAKDGQFYDNLAYVEKTQKEFPPCLELEPVQLKPGQVSRYQPEQERVPEVKLRELAEKSQSREPEALPNWASGEVKLGEPTGKFTQLEEPEPEAQVVHREQVKFKPVKPKPAAEKDAIAHFTIEEERAKMAQPKQGPAPEAEQFTPHKDQVQIRQKFKPKEVKPHEKGTVEGADKQLKEIPPVVKEEFEKSTVPSKPQPTKITPSAKSAPTLSTSLQSAQAEIGRSASFVIAYSGDEPVTVKWFHNGKQIRSAFDTAIRTTPGESRLDLSKLKESHGGEYMVRLENVGGQCESTATLSVSAAPDRGVAPQFSQRVADQRVQQGQTVKLSCAISGNPRPTISWFKDGKQLPNDDRYQQADSESETSLTIVDALPTDGGIYECVAKNPAGECRCKSRLNMILAKTGADAEKGPKQEAPRFADTIKPVIGQEGGNAEFRAKYTGEPEPTIRWCRNNEPIKQSDRVDFGHAEGDAWLRISGLSQEDVAEYKCEAINPVGRASTVANLALKPAAGKVIGGKPGLFAIQGGAGKFGTGPVGATKSPQFLSPLNAINARQGENVKFVAEIGGDPLPTVQWLCNGKPVIAGGFQLITQEDNRVSLEIKKVTPSNAGTYMCQIRNQHGAAQSQASLSVQRVPLIAKQRPLPTSRPAGRVAPTIGPHLPPPSSAKSNNKFGHMSRSDNNNKNDGNAAVPPDQLDLRRPGSFDQCWKMVAQKITNSAFWIGAELFLSVSAPLGGHQSVQRILAQHIRHLFGVVLPRWEDIVLVPNAGCALQAFSAAFCSAGDVLLCPAPFSDPELPASIASGPTPGVELRAFQLENAAGGLELADLEKAKQDVEGEGRRVRALLLHNPHPLLGGSIRGGNRLLARILEWTSERDLYLLVDESMASFDLWQFSSCLGLDHRGGGQLGQKLVWLWDGAKHLSLPGLEFAAILAPQPERLHPFVRAHPCAPLVQFLTAKLLEDFDWTAELFARRKSRLDELRRSTIEGLAQMGIGEAETAAEASPWILADLKKFLPGEDAQSETALREEFAQSGRLLLASGQQLGMDEFGWFQLRVGQSEEQVEEVLSRLKFVLEGRRRGAAGPVEWERMDVSAKYGGRRIGWEEIDGTIEEKLAMEAIEAGQEEMADEEEEDNVLEPTHREWTMMMPSTSEGAAQMPSLFAYEEEEIRRLSLIREEEGEEDELLRQVFAFEGKKREEERAGRRGTEDEVMREVFAIFPAERLRWKEPLVEEKSAEEEPIGIVETKEGWEEEKMEEKEETRKEEEEVEEVVRIEEYDYVEVKKTVPEDVRNGLDAEREKEQKREEEAQEEYQPKWPTTLTDFSFIEELVRSSEHESAVTTRAAGRMGGEIKLDESGEFYDEASTEEEEGKEEEAGREWRREGKAAEHLTAPLTIDVPILVDKSEQIGEETAHFDESSDSRRIIDIIDQIFHEAVQIRDFSSSSNDSHPNQAVTVHYQQGDHPYWSSTRSDSGLAAESPPDLSFSPLTDTGHQLDSIEERDAEHSTGASPEPTRNEAGQMRLFGGFREGPIQTSTLVREGKRREEGEDEEEEQRSHLGPTAQMLDDSGIFVELPLGSLSIDFPLLVPIGHLRRAQEDGGGIEEGMLRRAKQLDEEEEGGMTVDLRFMTRMEEEEVVEDEGTRGQIRLGKDVAAMEHDHQEMAGKTTVQIRETSERAQIGWEPLENLQEGSLQVGTQRIRVVDSEEAAEEKRREEEEKERLALIAAAMLNEGSAFCPSQSSPIEVVPRGVGGELGGGGEVVPVWEPLGQLKEEGMPKGSEMVREEKGKEEGKKFSETLDELEQIGKAEDKAKEEEKEEEMSRQGVTFATDYKSSVIVGEAEGEEGKMVSRVEVDDGQMRKRSMEPIDVVAEWNAARMAAKKAEMEDEMGKREVARESAEWADAIAEEGGGRRVIEAWEEQRSRAVVEEEVMMKGEEEEEGERLVKTVVKLEAPKKPPRVTMMGAGRRVGKKVEADEEEEAQTGSDHLENIPGRSQAYQVHHRMQMRRREGGRRAQSRDRVILEHMNITEVDYLGGRSERGEHLVTCISTRINRYAPDEFFRRLPVEGMPDLGQQRERMSKMVEVRRRRRTQSGPPAGMEAEGGRSDEIGRTETEMVTIRRLREGEEEEAARARGELHCGLARGGGKGEEEGEGAAEVLVKCQNAEHAERRHHCDPNRLYQLKRTTMMSENGYKKMKREHEERTAPERPPQLHSKFETIHYEMAGDETTKRATTARHRYRRPRRPRSPARIAVTTTRGGAGGGGESIDRVTVRHTPGSSWVVSSVYRTTEYGWERRALTRAGGDWRRSGAEAGAGFG